MGDKEGRGEGEEKHTEDVRAELEVIPVCCELVRCRGQDSPVPSSERTGLVRCAQQNVPIVEQYMQLRLLTTPQPNQQKPNLTLRSAKATRDRTHLKNSSAALRTDASSAKSSFKNNGAFPSGVLNSSIAASAFEWDRAAMYTFALCCRSA